MPRYFFHLRDGGAKIRDADGATFKDESAAVDHARRIAKELTRNRGRETHHWCVEITAQDGRAVSQLQFATVDETLAYLPAATRKLLEQRYEKQLALLEALARSRALVQQSRSVVGRSRGKPHLVTDQWGELIGCG
jgi:hypothetical protein